MENNSSARICGGTLLYSPSLTSCLSHVTNSEKGILYCTSPTATGTREQQKRHDIPETERKRRDERDSRERLVSEVAPPPLRLLCSLKSPFRWEQFLNDEDVKNVRAPLLASLLNNLE